MFIWKFISYSDYLMSHFDRMASLGQQAAPKGGAEGAAAAAAESTAAAKAFVAAPGKVPRLPQQLIAGRAYQPQQAGFSGVRPAAWSAKAVVPMMPRAAKLALAVAPAVAYGLLAKKP